MIVQAEQRASRYRCGLILVGVAAGALSLAAAGCDGPLYAPQDAAPNLRGPLEGLLTQCYNACDNDVRCFGGGRNRCYDACDRSVSDVARDARGTGDERSCVEAWRDLERCVSNLSCGELDRFYEGSGSYPCRSAEDRADDRCSRYRWY